MRELTARALVPGTTLYLPFDVPPGVRRVDVQVRGGWRAAVGAGLFDWRGTGYQSPGFRGMYGTERSRFHVALDSASPGFLPGPVAPGRWTVVVPVLALGGPATVRVTVLLEHGRAPAAVLLPPEPGPLRDEPGWYRGDLHVHTTASSDAWASGRAFDPDGCAAAAAAAGLDFVALTDHNVVGQNLHLGEGARHGVLLLGGQEVTDWGRGHALVTGLPPGVWVDWRHQLLGLPTMTDVARGWAGRTRTAWDRWQRWRGRQSAREPVPQPRHAGVHRLFSRARSVGAYTAVAHPATPGMGWAYVLDALLDPAARPDGMEVWNGRFRLDDEAALRIWDRLLRRGWRITATGGSDTHVRPGPGRAGGPGHPCTVVHADSLSRQGLVAALRRGRCHITRVPSGPGLYLGATGPDGQRQIMGGEVYGRTDDQVTLDTVVRGGAGAELRLVAGGPAGSHHVRAVRITAADQLVRTRLRFGRLRYVRAELRGPEGLAALSNPVFLARGRVPDHTPDHTGPPPV